MLTSVDIEETIDISLGDIIDVAANGGLDAFLDLIAERSGHEMLMDIDYEVVAVNEDKSLKLKVTGCEEVESGEPESEAE